MLVAALEALPSCGALRYRCQAPEFGYMRPMTYEKEQLEKESVTMCY